MADYAKTTWVENVTKVGPTRMNAIEEGIYQAGKKAIMVPGTTEDNQVIWKRTSDGALLAYSQLQETGSAPKRVKRHTFTKSPDTGGAEHIIEVVNFDGTLPIPGCHIYMVSESGQFGAIYVSGHSGSAGRALLIDSFGQSDFSLVQVGNTPPSSPVEGMEWVYTVASGLSWRFRWTDDGSAKRWKFIGGPPMHNRVETSEQRPVTAGVYADLATVGPSLTIPFAGDWLFEWGCNIVYPANYVANSLAAALLSVAGVQDTTTNITFGTGPAGGAGNSSQGSPAGSKLITGIAASSVVKMQYVANNGVANFRWRYLKATPVQLTG